MPEIIEKVRSRIQGVRVRRPILTQGQVVGGGAVIERVKQRAETVTARIKERKPEIVPKIKEWEPGARIREILAPQTETYYGGVMDRPGFSVETEQERKKPTEVPAFSVEW